MDSRGYFAKMAGVGRSPRLSLEEKGYLIGMHLSGIIVTDIAREINRSRRTVNFWIHRYNTEGWDGIKVRPRSGRPRELTEDEDQRIIAASE